MARPLPAELAQLRAELRRHANAAQLHGSSYVYNLDAVPVTDWEGDEFEVQDPATGDPVRIVEDSSMDVIADRTEHLRPGTDVTVVDDGTGDGGGSVIQLVSGPKWRAGETGQLWVRQARRARGV